MRSGTNRIIGTHTRVTAASGGRPGLRPRRRRPPPCSSARCQRRSVCGPTAKQDHRSGGSRRLAAASNARSAVVYRGRFPPRLRIASWWRRTTISSSRSPPPRASKRTTAHKSRYSKHVGTTRSLNRLGRDHQHAFRPNRVSLPHGRKGRQRKSRRRHTHVGMGRKRHDHLQLLSPQRGTPYVSREFVDRGQVAPALPFVRGGCRCHRDPRQVMCVALLLGDRARSPSVAAQCGMISTSIGKYCGAPPSGGGPPMTFASAGPSFSSMKRSKASRDSQMS